MIRRTCVRIILAALLAAGGAYAQGVLDVKVGLAQIFDVQWNITNGTLNASGFTRPYYSRNIGGGSFSGQLSLSEVNTISSTDKYFKFFASQTNPGTYGLAVYNSDGSVYWILHDTGSFRALSSDVIFYLGNNFYGTLITLGAGYAYGDSASFPDVIQNPTSQQLEAFVPASTEPLEDGETAGPGPVVEPVPSQLGLVQALPAEVASGEAFSQAPSIQVLDSEGNPIAQSGINIAATVNGGATIVGDAEVATDASGLAVFTGLGISGLVGEYVMEFSSTNLASVQSASIRLVAGNAAQVEVVTQPERIAAGVPVTGGFEIRLLDAQGNLATQSSVPVRMVLADSSQGNLEPAEIIVNSIEGIAVFDVFTVTGTAGDIIDFEFILSESVSATAQFALVELAKLSLQVLARRNVQDAFESLVNVQPGELIELKVEFGNDGLEAISGVAIDVSIPDGFRLPGDERASDVNLTCPHDGVDGLPPEPVTVADAVTSNESGLRLMFTLDATCESAEMPPRGIAWLTFTVEAW